MKYEIALNDERYPGLGIELPKSITTSEDCTLDQAQSLASVLCTDYPGCDNIFYVKRTSETMAKEFSNYHGLQVVTQSASGAVQAAVEAERQRCAEILMEKCRQLNGDATFHARAGSQVDRAFCESKADLCARLADKILETPQAKQAREEAPTDTRSEQNQTGNSATGASGKVGEPLASPRFNFLNEEISQRCAQAIEARWDEISTAPDISLADVILDVLRELSTNTAAPLPEPAEIAEAKIQNFCDKKGETVKNTINDLKFNDGSTFGERKEASKEPHKHRCMRCSEEFDCQSVGICVAGYDVMANIIKADLSIVEHCPRNPDWGWIRAYGQRLKESVEQRFLQANKLYEMALNNEIRWMKKHQEAEARAEKAEAELKARDGWVKCAERKPDCYGKEGFEIRLKDGSVLKNAILQGDDDWWWNGASEMFIDENLVDAWRLLKGA